MSNFFIHFAQQQQQISFLGKFSKIHSIFMFFIIFVILLSSTKNGHRIEATRIQGTFETERFYKFLVKFGFQKAEGHSLSDSYGYIYGNITSEDNFVHPVTLVLLDKHYFVEFYGNRSYSDRDVACQKMFSKISTLAYDVNCNREARTDYFRKIPCAKNSLCTDEDDKGNVISGNQFTYIVNHPKQARFWYLSMVSCYRNRTTCQWHYYDAAKTTNKISTTSQIIKYDINLVNGSPNTSTLHPLTFQFSFDQQNLLEMYLIFLLVYIILVPMQVYAVRLQKHPVTRLFTISLFSEFVSLVFITIHFINFAINGIGEPDFQTIGDILDIFSRTTFMLILLLLAKGWAVTRQQISKTGWIILMSIWIPYCAFHVFLYIWDRTEVDIISDIDEYQTWPGWIVLVLRTTFMMWFLWELRNTMKYEHSTKKLDFLLHLGASSLVWFIYLPIVAIVALQVSPMWRYKLLLGITNSADCLAYCVMTGLLWPNRVGQYLLLAGPNYSGMDELDEFNEAPHIVRERERGNNSVTNTNSSRPSLDSISIGNGHLITSNDSNLMNGDVCTDLLNDDIDSDLLTNLSKTSNIIA